MYVATLALATQCYAEIHTEKIEEAIEQSSLPRVKSLLGKVERGEMTAKARKKLYMNFYDLAVETTENRTQNLSMVGNWRDMLRTGLGVTGLLLSGLTMSFGTDQGDDMPRWLGFGVLGVYFLYRGIACSAQKAEIASAKSVEKYIKGKLTKLDVSSDL